MEYDLKLQRNDAWIIINRGVFLQMMHDSIWEHGTPLSYAMSVLWFGCGKTVKFKFHEKCLLFFLEAE